MGDTVLDYRSPGGQSKGSTGVMVVLSAMMFLQFFIWGSWYVTMSTFMGSHGMGDKIGRAYTLAPFAAIISPFFLGIIADRFFPSQRILGVMHLLGALAMFALPAVIPAVVANPISGKPPLLAPGASATLYLTLIFLHSLFYMPTINLTNSVAFAHLTNQEKQFPYIRVCGTLGWIAAGLVVSGMKVDDAIGQYQIAGFAALALAGFSFFLPHTPPPAKGKKISMREVLGLDALALFKHRSFAVFAISSFLICIPLAAYYSYGTAVIKAALLVMNPENQSPPVAAWMAIGQAAEVGFMLIIPFFFRKLGVKWMLAIGMLSWVVRYGLFAAGITGPIFSLLIVGVALHGLCYDFFFVTGFMYTDKRAAKSIAAQAQGLIVFLTYGVGLALGGYLTGELFNNIVGDAPAKESLPLYAKFWIWPAAFAAVVLIIFTLFFRDDTKDPPIGSTEEVDQRGFEVAPVARGEALSAAPGTGA